MYTFHSLHLRFFVQTPQPRLSSNKLRQPRNWHSPTMQYIFRRSKRCLIGYFRGAPYCPSDSPLKPERNSLLLQIMYCHCGASPGAWKMILICHPLATDLGLFYLIYDRRCFQYRNTSDAPIIHAMRLNHEHCGIFFIRIEERIFFLQMGLIVVHGPIVSIITI